jgi:hypothetical protein
VIRSERRTMLYRGNWTKRYIKSVYAEKKLCFSLRPFSHDLCGNYMRQRARIRYTYQYHFLVSIAEEAGTKAKLISASTT